VKLTEGLFWHSIINDDRLILRPEFDAHAHARPAPGQRPGQEKLILAQAAIGRLQLVVGRIKLTGRVRVQAAVGPGSAA
jgi:hypothetical protein